MKLTTVAALALLGLLSGCSASNAPSDDVGTVRVRAVLTSTRPTAHGHEKTLHAPLSGYQAVAVAYGARVTAPIDEHGNALLRLSPGTYSVSTSMRDACPPVSVTAKAGGVMHVRLKCVAP
jgi:hypothetical protein